MRALRRKWIVIAVAVLVAIGMIVIGSIYLRPREMRKRESVAAHKPEAPPDLEKLRDRFLAGLAAIRAKDGAKAVNTLASFNFGKRAVEEYRLYYLARGHELAHNHDAARRTLDGLWQRGPHAVIADDLAQRLAGFYAEAGDYARSARLYDAVAARSDVPNTAAAARWGAIESHFINGDVAGVLAAARATAISSPRAPQAV